MTVIISWLFLFPDETKYFTCRCVRCADPTELGTMFSSVRCPQCSAEQAGYLVSTDPVPATGVPADWKCNVCTRLQPHTFVDAVTQVPLEYLRIMAV